MKKTALLAFLLISVLPAFSADKKIIALTFDDGPRPYVLLGTSSPPTAGLLDVLDKQGVKATFFVMGWRLTPKTWGDRRETNIGVTCLDAAQQVLRRGQEIENHTFSHVQLRAAEKQKGEKWVIADVDNGARVIQAVTGTTPKFIRPPDWILPDDARHDIEREGYRVLTISNENPPALRDVNSQDYLCAGSHPVHCPRPSLADSIVRQIEAREKQGITTHILALHELSTTVAVLPQLITTLKARGYRFVRLDEYMKLIESGPAGAAR